MNDQQYRKQLLVQQIDAHRGLMRLEIERAQDLNPFRPFIDLGKQVLGMVGLVGSGGQGGGSVSAAGPVGLSLGVIVPFVIQVATILLKRRRRRK